VDVCDSYEVIESVVVGMDPILNGFAGVLVELVFDGERFVLAETALGSGNRLLWFSSESEVRARALFDRELGRDEGRPAVGAREHTRGGG
jgi:hypothetical protein